MKDIWIRYAAPDDAEAIYALNDAAFNGAKEAKFIAALEADGDSLLSLVAHNDREILGHIQFFPILVDGEPSAVGLGRMSVLPGRQNQGIGTGLASFGLTMMEGAGHRLVFVMGQPEYYKRFGFSSEAAEQYTAPRSVPSVLAMSLGNHLPAGGKLTYPDAFRG